MTNCRVDQEKWQAYATILNNQTKKNDRVCNTAKAHFEKTTKQLPMSTILKEREVGIDNLMKRLLSQKIGFEVKSKEIEKELRRHDLTRR
mgnify:CR=1 FL=1